jgi:peptidoglycan/LPS O-acetylase OafA/YrhL
MRITIEKWSLLALARFVLAFIVMVEHIHFEHFAPLGLLSIIPPFGAFEAVLGFLLISGFSIGNSYRKESEGFLKRRALRIYPVYIGALVLACIAVPQAFDLHSAGTLAQNLLFLNQITTPVSLVGPAWSLALEVWLYCLTPLLWRMQASHLRILMFASFAVYCCYELGRTAFHLPYYAGAAYGIDLPALAFPWLAGFLIAREPSLSRRTVRDAALLLLGHVLLAAAVGFLYRWKHAQLADFFIHDLSGFVARGLTLTAVAVLFMWIVEGRTGDRRSSIMRLLGDMSYPLYLIHMPLFFILSGFGVRNAMLYIAAALLVALLFYGFLDFYSRARERREPVGRAITKATSCDASLTR